MGEYLFPLLFLAAVFVGFGLVHGNHRGGSCGDCGGDCDKSHCERS
ncbi:MAG: hypothetical protein HKO85_11285 [Xanthomonadales bacterium]|nr:hypothetical protein [Gammaproteobacteria bacterium]MBT8057535.1 hypothetical protein [Gammaproteobacteria bacterium]NNL05861.1 hypothetical protein [Xanthomonadales bacterium]